MTVHACDPCAAMKAADPPRFQKCIEASILEAMAMKYDASRDGIFADWLDAALPAAVADPEFEIQPCKVWGN